LIKPESIRLDGRFKKQAKVAFGKYQLDIGVLQNKPHKVAASKGRGLRSFAGGPVRKTSRSTRGTISEVSERVRKNTGINLYTRPFKSKKNRDILNLIKRFMELCTGRGQKKRLENAMQAVVRNPILRGDYGGNKASTKKTKGFSRLMIDTGQLFKGIIAKVTVKNNVSK